MNTSTPILDSFNAALAQFCDTQAANLGGRIRWTGTPEQVRALESEIMGSPGSAIPATNGGPVFRGLHARHVGQWLNVALFAHPDGGGFSIDEAAPPALTHPVEPVLVPRAPGRPPRPAPATLTMYDLHAQARETTAHLLAEAREPYVGFNEKATLVGAAAQLLAVVK